MKRGDFVYTVGAPAVGSWPAVAPERVKILCRAHDVTSATDDVWFIVRFKDGSRMCMHESSLRVEPPVPHEEALAR